LWGDATKSRREVRKVSRKAMFFCVAGALSVVVAVYLGAVVVFYSRYGPEIRFHSDMSLLNSAITGALQEYYDKEGRYPDSLEVVKTPILNRIYEGTMPERPPEMELLPNFEYSTDGESYALAWSVRHRNGSVTVRKECGRGGKLVRLD